MLRILSRRKATETQIIQFVEIRNSRISGVIAYGRRRGEGRTVLRDESSTELEAQMTSPAGNCRITLKMLGWQKVLHEPLIS
jgi:hypothetical protein